MPRALRRLQLWFERLYDVPTGIDVREHVVGAEQRARLVEATTTPEQLLVREDGEALELGLYLDPGVLGRLAEHDPGRALDARNLNDFCVVAEGVSHFVYVAWRARFERPVTQLELEIQAEVDKFVACFSLLERQGRGLAAEELCAPLFESYTLHPDLGAEERERYRLASELAHTYCRRLASRHLRRDGSRSPMRTLLGELRRLYRMGQEPKMRAMTA